MAKKCRPTADFETSPLHLIAAREQNPLVPKGIYEFAQPQYSISSRKCCISSLLIINARQSCVRVAFSNSRAKEGLCTCVQNSNASLRVFLA